MSYWHPSEEIPTEVVYDMVTGQLAGGSFGIRTHDDGPDEHFYRAKGSEVWEKVDESHPATKVFQAWKRVDNFSASPPKEGS